MIIDPTQPDAIHHIVEHLRAGELVAIPTETVYGLAGDASNQAAIKKIFALKERPLNHPLIVHLAHAEQMQQWARDIPDAAWQLAQAFWPGPMTLILPKATHVSGLLTGNQETVGLRVPEHPVALKILAAFGGALAAPSANPFTALSPTRADHVEQFFSRKKLWVVDGGPSNVGLESTIIDCSPGMPVILRPGMITAEMIRKKIGLEVQWAQNSAIKHAGQHRVHYLPKTLVRTFTTEALTQALMHYASPERLGLLLYQPGKSKEGLQKMICLSEHPKEYAKNFYHALHELDQAGCDELWVELPPDTPDWQAIHERLSKQQFQGPSKTSPLAGVLLNKSDQ